MEASTTLALLLALWVGYHLSRCVYNVYFHPLRQFPGPKSMAASQLVNVIYILRGINCQHLHDLHERYGPVIRTGPNELSFRTSSAIKTIYGGNPKPEQTFTKNMVANMQENGQDDNIFFAMGSKHQRYRKIVAPAYSEATIRAQEPMVYGYCTQLVKALRDRSGTAHFPNAQGVVDIVPWTHFIVSATLGHVLFGSSPGPPHCLESGEYHPWIEGGFNALIESTYIEAAQRLWPYHKLIEYLWIPSKMSRSYHTHLEISQRKLKERAAEPEPYKWAFPSFAKDQLSEQEVLDNVNVIATAAGETTSSTISAALYYLTTNKTAYDNVVKEIRGAFARGSEITSATTAALPYLKATIRETFRIHPTIPVGLHRVTPRQGKDIDGHWVPGGTWVSVANLAACRTPAFWKDPEEFIPERWLGLTEFESDNRDASVPYSIGVRNCVGMSYANSQIRVVLAHLLLNFDFEAVPGNTSPDQYLEFGTWQVQQVMLKILDRS